MTIAIAAAASLFVALIAGSSLRPRFAAASLPEPAAWTHGSDAIQPSAAHRTSHLDHGMSAGSRPADKKPFHSMWMTRARPTNWAPLSLQLDWLALPASFVASQFQAGGAPWAAPATAAITRDILALVRVVRC